MSIMKFTTEIEEIIKKNLPSQVGDTLKERLDEAEKDRKDLFNAKIRIQELEKECKEKDFEISNYKKLDERNSKLDDREIALNLKFHDLDLTILREKLNSEKEKTEFTKSIALGLVRNTEYRKQVFDTENQLPYQDNSGLMVYPTPINKSLTETKITD